ncbi:MAG: DUF4175 family protein [Deltaproteobacteria bacterium]|nr:DUF4175 family protein [Deltaproteobacteria bacterium]
MAASEAASEPRSPGPAPERPPSRRRGEPTEAVRRGLRSLRRGVRLVFGLRALALGLGAGGLVFALSALAVGPVSSMIGAALGWSAVGLCAVAGFVVGWWPSRALRAGAVSRLFATVSPPLVSATRSVLELANDRSAGRDLVEAHAERVAQAMAELRLRRLWPWKRLRSLPVLLGLLALAGGALLLGTVDRARSGAFALTHPGARADEGTRVASVVGTTRAELRFPAYMSREPQERLDAERLEAPLGTAVRLSFRPLVPITEATLDAPGQLSAFERGEDGWWTAPFTVRQSGTLAIEVRDESGRTLRDASSRAVVAIADEAPAVVLESPEEDLVVDLAESVSLTYEASDALGVVQIDLCIRTPGGPVERRSLQTFPTAVPFHHGRSRVAAVELGARPGDAITFWIEAQDSDDVSGPNVGRSVERTLRVASEATRREAFAGDLREVLDAALNTLADRLERPVPDGRTDARTRDEALAGPTDAYLDGLHALAEGSDESFDPSVLRSMWRELGRDRAREARTVDDDLASRRAVNGAMVERLEDHSLFLADLLGRARLQDAAALARELEELRREMRSLLSELRRTESPEAREALLAALARAQARLAELERRIATMGDEVPQEFLNTDSLEMSETSDALSDMRGALERGDLDAAERALTALEQRIDALAKTLGQAGESYGEARFGPRQQAMAEALDRLAGLEAEQRQLAERTQEVRREAAERALGAAGAEAREAARGVAERARSAAEALEQLPRDVLSPSDEENLDRARQRLSDTAAALETGDLGEARRMAAEAEREADRLARDLEVSAMMFSGREGRTAQAAQQARRASESVRGMGRALDDALPRVADFVEDRQNRQMETDSERQGLARDVAGELREQFGAEPDGTPLSPEGAEVMERVEQTMGEARDALRRSDPLGASRSQQEAARDLTELREKLEQQSQSQQNGGGEGGEAQPDYRRRVSIPEAREDAEAARRRRRILDAMRNGAPEGYEDAVRRYYEELLR